MTAERFIVNSYWSKWKETGHRPTVGRCSNDLLSAFCDELRVNVRATPDFTDDKNPGYEQIMFKTTALTGGLPNEGWAIEWE